MTRSITKNRRKRAVVLLCGAVVLATALCAFCADAPPAGTASVDWSAAQLVKVELVDERFVPDKLSFRRGIAYRLRLENTGTAMHMFTAPEFFKAVSVKNPEALDARQNEILLHPKEYRDVYFVPQKPGRYELICADHDWAGMTGAITIE